MAPGRPKVLEVSTVLRESGFSPLGIPRRRGLVYVIDRNVGLDILEPTV